MRLTIDTDKCSGHGRCYSLAPDFFDCDDEGFPVILKSELDATDVAAVKDAVANCPERAIALVEGA
ncbi:ferredoxin [Nocardioides alcanivorans]|uniref:ferredoxin n=1 Tax=Nocardioides alcanivorans TaxID=2897352 RepID=UPI001F22C757|nr:ferredoxin [Nocardioides alcanivorans]